MKEIQHEIDGLIKNLSKRNLYRNGWISKGVLHACIVNFDHTPHCCTFLGVICKLLLVWSTAHT